MGLGYVKVWFLLTMSSSDPEEANQDDATLQGTLGSPGLQQG